MIKYVTFSLAIAFISWIVGIFKNAFFSRSDFYQKRLCHPNFIKDEKINRLLGLDPFKWVIRHSIFKFLNPKLSIKKRILRVSGIPVRNNHRRTKSPLRFVYGDIHPYQNVPQPVSVCHDDDSQYPDESLSKFIATVK
jgi:hypothetical protein